jgi:hypothetical protein
MKFSALLLGAAAVLAQAAAEVEVRDVAYVVKTVVDARIEVRVDSAGKTAHVFRRINTDVPAELQKRACPKNNCLRALVARPAVASTFCATYTTAVSTGVAPFTQCANSAKLSEACSCQYPVSRRSRWKTRGVAPGINRIMLYLLTGFRPRRPAFLRALPAPSLRPHNAAAAAASTRLAPAPALKLRVRSSLNVLSGDMKLINEAT